MYVNVSYELLLWFVQLLISGQNQITISSHIHFFFRTGRLCTVIWWM